MANENRRKLYNAINQAGYDIGDYDEFDKRMNNAADRQKFFQAVNDAGYDIGSQEDFERRISPTKYKLKTGGKYIPVSEREYKDFTSRHSGGGSGKPSTGSDYQQTINDAMQTVAQSRQTVTLNPAPSVPQPSKPWGARQVRTTEPASGVSDRAPFRKDLTAAERAEIERNNNYAARQVDKFREGRKREDARRNTPIATTGNEAVDRYVVKTQGQYEDEVERGIRDLGSRYVSPVVQKAMQDMDDQWYATMGEAGSAPMGEGGEIAALRRANESIDPDKVLEGLRQRLGSIYSNPDMQRDIEEKARKAGIPKDEYVSRFVEPAMKEQLESDFASSMIARNLPKNATEYIMQGLGDSIGGMLMGASVETKGQRAYRNQADAMTEEGGNPYYTPGTGARLTRMGVSFAADAPFFGVYGKVSGSVVKNIAERQIRNMMAKGLSEGAARSIVGTALENSVGARMKNYLMQHVVSSSLTMGAYNATSETARQLRDKEGIDIGSIASSTGEGLATGAAFGVTGGVSQALSQPLSGIRKVGAKIAGFGAEAETMYATEELAKMAHGEEGFTDPFEGGLEAVEKLGVMKLSGGHLLESTGKRVLRAKEAGVRQAAIETLADFLGKNRSGVEFSRDEEAYVRNSAEGKSLLEALSGMHPELAVSEVNGKKRLTKEGEQMRRALSESYNSFMENAEIPATVKQKVAGVLGGIYRPGLETGADILHNADGSVVVKTRDKNGNCIRDIKFDSFDEARQWQDSQKSQFSRNDAVDMWNNASVETRQKIVDAVRDEVSGKNALEGKRAEIEAQFAKATGLKQKRLQRQLAAIDRMNEEYRNLEDGYEGREMTDEEARNFIQTVIRDGSDEVFDGMYGLISDTVHPTDEYNPQRRYQEGRRMSAEERHIAKADLQLQEERLLLIGEDFAKEVTDNADYADEKMAELAGRRDVSGEQLEAARDYYNAKARLDGALDETMKGVDEQVEEANATIRRNTHPGSGSLIEASHDGRSHYVTAGHFQVTPDGRIEPTDDSGVVILRDRETGEISVVNPRDVLVTAINDPQRMMEANDSMDGLRGELMRQAEEGIELHPDTPDTPQSGDSFTGEDGQHYAVMEMQDEQGNPVWMKVAVDEAGNMTGEPQPLDLGEYRRAKSDEMDRAERPQTEQPPVEQDTPPAEEAAPLIDDLENRLQGTDTETAGNYAQNGGENIPKQGNNGVGNIPDSRIPVDDKGKKIYEQARPEDTLSELTGKYGEEKARQFIAKMAENTARALDELSRKDTSKMTDANDLEAYNDELSELQKKADYWKGLIKPEETKVEKAIANNRPVLSDETNEYGKKFVVSGDGSTIFGEITQESGLTPAPIKLSEGEDSVDENGRHHGYGLLHIEASHGDQIRKAGYPSVQAFVEDVARNYDTIREGNAYGDSHSYLLEITDEKDNTVFIEMSRDGNYWNVNSAGIFRKSYSRNKKEVQSLPTIGSDANADITGVNHGQSEGATVTSENSPSTSDGKDTKKNDIVQENQQKNDVSRQSAPVQPVSPSVNDQRQPEAQRKVYEGSVRNNVGRTFEFTDKSGKRTEITITGLTDDGQAEVRRRDFDAHGTQTGEDRVQQFPASRIGEGIVNGTWKRTMTDGERLRDAYKGRMGMENLIETLGDDEASALWAAHERARTEDGEAAKADLREMLNDLQHRHVEDIVDNGRARRVAEAEKALSGGRYADKLRKLRRAYQGIDGMDDILSDHALEPVTIEEYAAAYLGDVPKAGAGFIDHESLVAETGHGSRRIGGDSRAYSSYLAPKGKGRSIKQIAHEMWQDLPDRLHDEWTDQDCLNALVEVLTSGEKPSDVAGYILRNRQRQAEELARAQEDESLNAYFSGEIKFQKVVRERFRDRLDSAIADTDTEPTEAQKEAGNYRKGHISFGGYDLTIENPAGSIRRGTGSDGRPWEHQMQNTYGYILGKKGKDGDHLDMFINDDADLDSWNGNVYVVDQVDPKTGKFDEHKIMYGFDSEAEAREAYLSNYADGWKGLGRITGVSKETFDKWLESSERKIKEFSDHSIVKEAAGNKIQGLKGYTKADVLDAVRGDIDSILEENGIDSVEIKGMDLHGSRMRGDAREDSDLDVVVEYEGDISEDGLFNILNENPVTIEGIRVDINPITKGKSGTLEQYMERSRKYDDEKRKSSENGANRADKADKANKPNKPNRADKAAPIGSTSSQEQVSGQNHMVEGEPLSPVSEQETALRDAVVKHLRSLGVEVSTDWEEGQRILDEYNGNGPIKKMGTTTNNRMSDVATQFADKQLTDQQSVIASVYTGEKDNQTATFKREDGSAVRMKFQQGEDTKAGTKHSLFAHYGTTKGVISADDILRIPDAIEKGNRKQKGKNVEYTLKDGKTTYTVYAKVKGGIEVFQDFYSSWKIKNKETSASKPSITQGENTQSAQSDDANVSSGAKVQQNPETDKDSDRKFFKTPDGHAYGYTYKGKIYIDPRIATAETPVHEYGHLWCEMKRDTAPEEWGKMKEVMLGDKKVQPIIERVKRDYPELAKEGREDDFIEEIITQFSGKRGAERLREIANEVAAENGGVFGKAEAVTAMQRLKNVLNRFWEGVARMMGWKYRTADQIADRMMADMLNGVNPRERMDGKSTSKMREQQEIERTLMGVHNISEEKLKKVLKQGGLANPSLAVIDTRNGMHTDFGDISLIPRSSLIDSKKGNNAGTYTGDAWTPTYPQVVRELSKKGEKSIGRIAKDAAGGNEELERHLLGNLRMFTEGNGSRLHLLYLLQKGKSPEILNKKTKHTHEEYEELMKLFPTGDYSTDGLTKEQNDGIMKLMLKEYEAEVDRRVANIKDEAGRAKVKDMLMKTKRESIADADGNLYFSKWNNYFYAVKTDENTRKNPQVDWYGTDLAADNRIAREGMSEDYAKWKEGLLGDEDMVEKLFAGFDRDGNRKYLPNTAENASRLMNRQGDTNTYGNGGLNATRANLLKKLGSLSEIRKHRELLQGKDAYDEKQKEMSDELFDIISQISDMQQISDNRFANTDYAESRLQEAIAKRDPLGYLKKEYGYDISKDSELGRQIMNFIEEAGNLPVKYFETKFKRPVGLDEFAVAVVPETTSPEVVKALKDAGLDVRTYNNTGSLEQQNENRRQATMDAVQGRDDIMFQKKREAERVKTFHDAIDEMFSNPDFDKTAHSRDRYDLGDTPEFMKKVGITGDSFSLSFKNIKTHMGKDADHNLTAKEWHELPEAIKKPFLITTYGDKEGRYRLYTSIKVGNKFAVVGIDVVKTNQGKDKPILEVNRIKTVFGRDRYVMENGEKILAYDERMTPEQEALLRGHNFREYPSVQELSSVGKDTKNIDTIQENGQENADEAPKFQRVGHPEPELTPEERQYWKKWEGAMKKWRERNGLPADAEAPAERPRYRQGESAMDYAKRVTGYMRERALWETAPKLEDYRQARDDKAVADEAREAEKAGPDVRFQKGTDDIKPVGKGDFGDIYDQFKGKPKEAVDFLIKKKGGEAIGALSHKDVGDIDLVWGEEGTGKSDGFGLAKLAKYHPEVLDKLQEILDDMHVTKRTENRINLESDTHQAAVRLTWNDQKKNWLLTAFEKKNSALDNTTDTGKTSDRGKRNDTATPQSTVSVGKDTKKSPNFQGNGGENAPEEPKFQRVVSPEPELTPEERQYWKKWEGAMKKWRERNGLPADAEAPAERPRYRQGESAMDYAKRVTGYMRERALWETAPKLEDYRQARDDKAVADEAREAEKAGPDLFRNNKALRAAADMARIRHAMARQKAYDKATVKAVTDFAQDFMRQGFGDNLGRGDIERLLSSVKNATGGRNVKKEIDNIQDILVDNFLRNLENSVVKLSSVKELRQTAQGVEKQGKLELKGQRMIQAFREARDGRLAAEQIRERMSDVLEKISANDGEAPMREQEYEGLSTALQYVEGVDASRQEYASLKREYDDAVKGYKQSGRSYKAQQQLLESLDEAMQENKIERIGLYGDLIGRLQGNISESVKGAREFVEKDKERVKKIQQMANFDLAGKPMGAMRQESKGNAANFFLQSLGTFEQMLRQFGGRNANGEGYLYDYFIRNWMDATDNAFKNEQKAKEDLDAKAREVFGKKVKRWSDLYGIARDLPTMDVEMNDGTEKKTFTLNQGNLLYIYMADKMSDGRMKLRKMGIDEDTVGRIKEFLDPRLLQLGDWLQGEYLPRKRTEYNKVHERMFGAPMAAIDNYFPLKVLGDARYQEQDVNVPDSETLPSTITGNIIKRTRNTLALDVLHTDALSLAIEHVEDMERWAAQAEWNRDVNTLLSYTTFRNKVKNMKTIYGSGDALWNAFKDAAKMAAGTYNPSAKSGHVDAAISNIAKGVTAAKINFRVYTAFKQILSAPAFLHDVNLADFVHDSANPYGSWKWAMENMPVFQKRWKSRQVGDTRLMDDPTDWKMWKSNVVQMATRMGMSANALVDGVTCAVGARSIYKSRYKRYKEIGASDEVAHKRALQDAEIGYNLTQQSSEGAFVSTVQKDRTVAANMLSVFRNSSMAYTRQWVDAARNLRKRTQKGYRDDSIKFMTRQMQEQFNLDEAEARKAAEQEYAREGRRDVARMLNMMFGVTVAWNLGASLPYLLVGDDDNTKKEMLTDALLKGLLAGPVEGLAAGNMISDLAGRTLASEETRKAVRNEGWGAGVDAALRQGGDYEVNPLPLMADIQGMIKKLGYDKFAAAQDVFNICMQSAVGVNPQTFTDMWNACMDYGAPAWDGTKITDEEKDFARPKEIALFIMRVLNAPTGSWRNKYIDELGMNAEDARKLPYEEMARRYAHYKHWKDAPIMGWLRGEEGRQKKMETIRKQFDKAVDDRIARLTDDELKSNLARSKSIEEKRRYARLIHSRLGGNGKDAGNAKEEWQREYQGLMQYDDIREDEELSARKKAARDRGDTKTVKAIEKLEDRIRDKGKKMLGKGDDDSGLMGKIRQWRAEALEIALKAEPQQGGSEGGGRYDKGGVFRYDDVADAPMDGYAGQMERRKK